MKVNSAQSQNIAKTPKKPSKEDIEAKIKAKFGVDMEKKKAEKAKAAQKDVVVSIDKKGEKEVSAEGFGDIKKNDPNSEVTQEKLRTILKRGGFEFNPKERKALQAILS
jgi:DNA-directed RNA polymerase specialized sigma subunit